MPPNQSAAPPPQHPVFPYLLRKMQIDRPNQAWCADITFVPVRKGFLYLVAIMDWATRKVLSWRLSNTMHADFCVEALNEAIAKRGTPEIMSTDQGCQFTGSAWTSKLIEAGVGISMDGRGRYLDNIFIERLWRSLKQEAIYLEEIQDGFQARRVISNWMAFYNTKRPHSALDRLTPDDVYRAGLKERHAARNLNSIHLRYAAKLSEKAEPLQSKERHQTVTGPWLSANRLGTWVAEAIGACGRVCRANKPDTRLNPTNAHTS